MGRSVGSPLGRLGPSRGCEDQEREWVEGVLFRPHNHLAENWGCGREGLMVKADKRFEPAKRTMKSWCLGRCGEMGLGAR